MRARDIMTRSVVSVSPDHSVHHAARLMLDNHVSGLPVLDDDQRLLGILTEGDLLRRSELGRFGTSPMRTFCLKRHTLTPKPMYEATADGIGDEMSA